MCGLDMNVINVKISIWRNQKYLKTPPISDDFSTKFAVLWFFFLSLCLWKKKYRENFGDELHSVKITRIFHQSDFT